MSQRPPSMILSYAPQEHSRANAILIRLLLCVELCYQLGGLSGATRSLYFEVYKTHLFLTSTVFNKILMTSELTNALLNTLLVVVLSRILLGGRDFTVLLWILTANAAFNLFFNVEVTARIWSPLTDRNVILEANAVFAILVGLAWPTLMIWLIYSLKRGRLTLA